MGTSDDGMLDAARSHAFHRSPTAMALVGADTVVLDVNAAFARLFAQPAEAMVGQLLVAVARPEHRDAVEAWLGRCASGEPVPLHLDSGLVGSSGPRWFATDGEPVVGADGTVEAFVITVVESSAEDAAAEQRWRVLVRHISDTVTVVGADGRIVSTTGEMAPVLGYPTASWVGRPWDANVHPDDLDRLAGVVDQVLHEPGEHVTTEARLRHHDGSWADVWVNAVNLLDDPAVRGVVLTTRNITEQKRAEDLVASQAAILELIATGTPLDEVLEAVAAMVEDHDPGAQATVALVDGTRLRPRARAGRGPAPALRAALGEVELTPEAHEAFGGRHGVPIVRTTGDPNGFAVMQPALRATGVETVWWAPVVPVGSSLAVAALVAFDRRRRRPDDHVRRATEVACTLVAIALDRHHTVTELAHRELHDDLTGLPNRTLLLDRLQTSLDREHRVGTEVGVLHVDLDRFKLVNERCGLPGGDAVLVAVAERLRAATRPGDTVARVGVDEFVVLCDRQGRLSTLLSVADRLVASLREPLDVGDGTVVVTASVGLAISDPDIDAPALLRQADAAMQRAKQRGRNRVEVFDPVMQAQAHHRLGLASDLRLAVARDELRMAYQPIVDLATGRIVGAEALCRWDHPQRGAVPPAEFIPVAEESGAISEIGPWALDRSLADMAPLAGTEHDFHLSVNLSARQLDDPGISRMVVRALAAHGWQPARLCLELTETAITDDLDLAATALLAIRATGVRIAVDDFGTGYSSLTHLQRLPIDAVKVDRSFVQGLGEPGAIDRASIVGAVVGIAAAMGLQSVAEGIETDAQLHALTALGCTHGQGYLFSSAVPPDALVALVLGA